MLWLLRYIIGYITIDIYGENCEQIINRAMANKISIWNLQYKNGHICGNVSANKFYKFIAIRHGVNCKVKLVKKYGLIFYVKNYKKRLGIALGAVFFFLILFILSNFIWIINVNGNNVIPSQEIIKACGEIGITEGTLKHKIKNKYDAQKLQLAQPKIAWCALNVEGCLLTVNISEIKYDDSNKHTPTNLKSKTAGKIKKIDIKSGDVLVSVGEYVFEGDLLVSGIVQNNSGAHLVYSDGEIIAETERVFSAEGMFVQNVLCTKSVIKHNTLSIFNIKIPLFINNINSKNIRYNQIKHLTLFNNKIPIKIATEKYDILAQETVTYSKELLKEILYKDVCKQVAEYDFISFKEKSSEIIETTNGLLLKITYICEENIATEDEILLSKVN